MNRSDEKMKNRCHPEPGGAPEGQSTAKDPLVLPSSEGGLQPSSAPPGHRRLRMTVGKRAAA